MDDEQTHDRRMSAIGRLRAESPTLYRGVIAVLGLAAGLSAYRSMTSNASYAELVSFAAVVLVLLSLVIVLEWIFRTERGRLVAASLILIAAGGAYSLGILDDALSAPSAPSVEARPLVCRAFPWACAAPPPGEVVASAPAAPAQPGVDPVAPTEADLRPQGPNRIWIQFGGRLNREAQIVPLAERLLDLGWSVLGGSRGGERIDTARGLSEIRFFYPSDRANAERLARALAASDLPADITDQLRLVALDADRYPDVREGTLEVWIGN